MDYRGKRETNISDRGPAKIVKESLVYPASKLTALLTVDLLEFLDEAVVTKLLKDGEYQASG